MAPLQALRDEPEQNEEGEEEGEQEGCGPYNLFDMFEDAAAAEAGEEEAEEEEENSINNATTAVLGGDVARLADVADGGDHECGESEEEAEEDSCVDPGDIPQADSVPQPSDQKLVQLPMFQKLLQLPMLPRRSVRADILQRLLGQLSLRFHSSYMGMYDAV